MSKIIIHEGANSIGGNKVELRDGDTRILFDFGLNMKVSERYFEGGLDPGPGSLADALLLGLIPPPERLGAGCYCGPVAGPGADLPRVSAVFLSHAHADHQGCVPYLNPEIPIYATPETAHLFSAKYVKGGYSPIIRELVPQTPVTIGKTTVDAVRVDHSLPGGCAFLITTSEGYRIAYSADLRLHGTTEHTSATLRLFSILKERWVPHVLICEGTNIDEYGGIIEESSTGDDTDSVKGYLREVIGRTLDRGKMVFVDVSNNNLDRMDTLYEIVDERSAAGVATTLHISAFTANALYAAAQKIGGCFDDGCVVNRLLSDPRIHVYRRSEHDTLAPELKNRLPAERRHLLADYRDPASLLRKDAVILFYIGDYRRLLELRPSCGSAYIRSDSAAFTDEMRIEHGRVRALVEALGLRYHQIHASGHIYAAPLKRAIREIDPRILVPIHTEHPDLFVDLLDGEDRCRIVRDGETLDLDGCGLLTDKATAPA